MVLVDYAAKRLWEGAVKLPRRQFLHLAAGAAALPAVLRIAAANETIQCTGRVG